MIEQQCLEPAPGKGLPAASASSHPRPVVGSLVMWGASTGWHQPHRGAP